MVVSIVLGLLQPRRLTEATDPFKGMAQVLEKGLPTKLVVV
jgi:hypothetical protein